MGSASPQPDALTEEEASAVMDYFSPEGAALIRRWRGKPARPGQRSLVFLGTGLPREEPHFASLSFW